MTLPETFDVNAALITQHRKAGYEVEVVTQDEWIYYTVRTDDDYAVYKLVGPDWADRKALKKDPVYRGHRIA